MRQVREILRLKFVGDVRLREIARRVGAAASTVRATVKRFAVAGLSWPLPDEMTDAALEERLFAPTSGKQGHRRQVEPDWAAVHRELKRKHVTLVDERSRLWGAGWYVAFTVGAARPSRRGPMRSCLTPPP